MGDSAVFFPSFEICVKHTWSIYVVVCFSVFCDKKSDNEKKEPIDFALCYRSFLHSIQNVICYCMPCALVHFNTCSTVLF